MQQLHTWQQSMQHMEDSSIHEIAEHHFPGRRLWQQAFLTFSCQIYMSVALVLRHVFFFRVHCRACFCLVLFLHHHSLCLLFSITKVPKDFSHFAVMLVVNNPMQRDEHTKGQYTNAMHMHVHAFHTHTHTQCTHDIHMHVCVDCI